MATDDGTLIFLHIFKTAGTSLRMMMLQQYPEDATYQFYKSQNPTPLEELPDNQRAKIRLMSSHEPLGTHDAYLTSPIHYITMLRDPVERVISQYNYRRTLDDQNEAARASVTNLSTFLSRGQQDNIHVRFISGQGFEGTVTEGTLKQARENLAAPFMTFGIVERYKESVLLFVRRFDWTEISLIRRNVTPRAAIAPADEAARKLIAEHNAYDLELYAYATQLFTQRISEAGITRADILKLNMSSWDDLIRSLPRLVLRSLRKSLRRI